METQRNKIMVIVIIGLLAIIFALITVIWNDYQSQLIQIEDPIKEPPVKISNQCEVMNCHGLDISCGSGPAKMCTEMYQIGDNCLQFARCGVVNGTCQQIENPQFTACKSCALRCQTNFSNSPEQALSCESNCGKTDLIDPIETPPHAPDPVPTPPYTGRPVERGPSDPTEIPPHTL